MFLGENFLRVMLTGLIIPYMIKLMTNSGGKWMDTDVLYANIKENCAQIGISMSQLEKELNFGTGAMGKWKQSAPSIEKVAAVAEYFHISLDELCGLKIKREKPKSRFMSSVIQKTLKGELVWYPCSYQELENIKFSPPIILDGHYEWYSAVFGSGSLYVYRQEENVMLYVSLEGHCKKQEEDSQQLQELWDVLQYKEQEIQEKINEYKKTFINE